MLVENPRESCAGLLGIYVAHCNDHGADAKDPMGMPGAYLCRRYRRKRFRQPTNGKPIGAVSEGSGKAELERVAEHVVRQLFRLDGHETPLGVHLQLPQTWLGEDQVEESCALAEVLC